MYQDISAVFLFHVTPQTQVIEFNWKDVKTYGADEDGMSFNFEYNRQGKKARVVKIFTPHVSLAKFFVLFYFKDNCSLQDLLDLLLGF